jgi:hypothetical protein
MLNTIDDVQARIDQLYKEMKPLQDYYGIRSKTIEERYLEYIRKQEIKNNIPKPRFKLPKL